MQGKLGDVSNSAGNQVANSGKDSKGNNVGNSGKEIMPVTEY